ncbi:MAG: DUF2817 domain-containing protein [Myxococcota bacterium]
MLPYLLLSISLAETPLWVYAPTNAVKSQLQQMPLGFTEQAQQGWLRMDAEQEGIDALRRARIPFTVAPSVVKAVPEGYHSPEEMNQALINLSEAYPQQTQLISLGFSVEGREILALRVGYQDGSALSYRILGAHHGDELPSGELVLAFAENLLNSPEQDIINLLEDAHIWLVPHVNPDGVDSVRRYNANNVDLNRNYGYMWNPNEFRPGSGPFSEKETQNIRQFGFWSHAAAALSLHAGATNIGWVWNYTETRSEDDQAVEALAVEYAQYCSQNQFWITNGADWYVTYGDTTDWAYGAHGVFDFTLEVSNSKQPSANQLPQILSDHLPAMSQFVLWPHWSSVTVVDADTLLPVTASLKEVNKDTVHVGDPNGHVSLLFSEAGNYEIEISASGYIAQTLTVMSGQTVGQIALQPNNLSVETIENPIFTANGFHSFPFDTTNARLLSEGQEPITLGAVGEQWRFDSSGYRPGLYHLEHDEGITKNALLLASTTPHSQVTNVSEIGNVMTFTVSNKLGAGARAWGVHNTHRNLIPLQLEESDSNYEIRLSDVNLIDTELIFLHSHGDIIPLFQTQSLPDTGNWQDSATDSGVTDAPNEPDAAPTSEPSNENSTDIPNDDQESLKAGCQTVPLQLPFVLPLLLLGIRRR